jgi:glycosyltransferase involved in cell wall biosynthesis
MYESTKDQVKYEREAGHQSDLCDTNHETPDPMRINDGWLEPITWDKAKDAEVWVLHSCIPEKLKEFKAKKVCVAVLHGPSEHMLLKEFVSERKSEAFNLHINLLWHYDATVVINTHEYDIMKLYDEHDRLHYIPNSIDLDRIKNVHPWQYRDHPAIMSCDVLRLEKLPASIIWSMPKIVERVPGARLNVFSLEIFFAEVKSGTLNGSARISSWKIRTYGPSWLVQILVSITISAGSPQG